MPCLVVSLAAFLENLCKIDTSPSYVFQAVLLHFTALGDHNVLHWLSFRVRDSSCVLNLCDNVHTFDNIAEDDMLAIQVRCSMLCGDDEELAAICL